MKKQAYECKRAVSFASRWKKQPVIYRNMENLRALMEAVCRIAREAGHFLKEERKSFRREVVQEKHAHDYVSYVDKASEKRIVSALKELLPEAGFITEEGSAVYQDEPYCWVVDPLDGTTNYIHDNAALLCMYSPSAPGRNFCWVWCTILAGMSVSMVGKAVALT